MFELLARDLEVLVAVPVLEEGLCIETLFPDNFGETAENSVDVVLVDASSWRPTVDSMGPGVSERSIEILLEVLLGENLVHSVAEFAPLDVVAGLGGLEVLAEHVEFSLRDGQLTHVESNSELSSRDETGSQFVEVTEELTETNALLAGDRTDACKNVMEIIRAVGNNGVTDNTRGGLGVVVVAVVEVTSSTVELVSAVDLFAEINIVDLINVSFVHVSSEDELGDFLGGLDAEVVQHTEELVLGHMAVLGDVEVLEDGLQVHTLGLNGFAEMVKDRLDLTVVVSEVLSAGEEGVFFREGGDTRAGALIDASDGEGLVDAVAEIDIIEEDFGVVRLILVGEGLKFIVGQCEVHV